MRQLSYDFQVETASYGQWIGKRYACCRPTITPDRMGGWAYVGQDVIAAVRNAFRMGRYTA